MPTIFISYRRSDSASETGRLYDRLVERYGKTSVFKDVDSIPPGVRFPDYIAESIQASDVALILIGSRWLDASSGWGRRRLDDPGDFVRIEIETALRLGVPVIPVLVNGATMPPAHRLPESLRPMCLQNAVSLRQDPDFSHDVGRVFHAVDYWQAQPRKRPAETTPVSTATATAPEDSSDALRDSSTIAKSPLAPRSTPVKVAVAAPVGASGVSQKRPNRRAPVVAATALALVVVATLVAVLRGLPGMAGATSLTSAQKTQTASALAAASATADMHVIQTQAAIASHATPITPGYVTANPGCDSHWSPPISTKRDCIATGMTLSATNEFYDNVSVYVSKSQSNFTVRVKVTNLQDTCAIMLLGDKQTLLIKLQQQTTLAWSVEATQGDTNGYAPTSGTMPSASSYIIVMQFVNNPDVNYNDLALSINGRPLPTTGKINPRPNGQYDSYYIGYLQKVGLSLASPQDSSTSHRSATFSDFSLTAP